MVEGWGQTVWKENKRLTEWNSSERGCMPEESWCEKCWVGSYCETQRSLHSLAHLHPQFIKALSHSLSVFSRYMCCCGYIIPYTNRLYTGSTPNFCHFKAFFLKKKSVVEAYKDLWPDIYFMFSLGVIFTKTCSGWLKLENILCTHELKVCIILEERIDEMPET